ncbi:MAG: WbqC family protein [Prevotellaceae bacterium]|nr:WbqC family protein [Prevotellaceae bacterium]
MELILSSAYFAPVQYFCHLACAENIYLEAHEHYQKQTYRTRCNIAESHGALTLSVPVEKVHGEKMLIRDVRIDYSMPWQHVHRRALITAYNSSPFFMYYADEILPFFERREIFLFDLNLKITQCLCDILGIRTNILLTEKYKLFENNPLDFRQSISPKLAQQKADKNFYPQEYFQVFAHKLGFLPNLSILDLLFNEGPEALSVLKISSQTLP